MGVSVKYKGVVSEGRVRELLREADMNKENNLSKAELKEALKKMGSKLQETDANHDGQIISLSEMEHLLHYIMNCIIH